MKKEKVHKRGVQIESSSPGEAHGAFMTALRALIDLYKPYEKPASSNLDRRRQLEITAELLRLFGIDRKVLENYAASPANEVSDVDADFLRDIIALRPRHVSSTK